MIRRRIDEISDSAWTNLYAPDELPYEITGKYLFFDGDRNRLLEIARQELTHHGFHLAKVSLTASPGQDEHVRCLYFADDSRKHELARRNREEHHVRYRYWKSDADTLAGKYSAQFLSSRCPLSPKPERTSRRSDDWKFIPEDAVWISIDRSQQDADRLARFRPFIAVEAQAQSRQ